MQKLEVKLKQHTPLIHFQHNQEGATLRASEVKPKLDKFFLCQFGKYKYDVIPDEEFDEIASIFEKTYPGKNFDDLKRSQQEYIIATYIARKNGWFIGKGDHTALNYKMRIKCDEPSSTEEYLLASYIKREHLTSLEDVGIHAISNTPYFAQEKENSNIARSNQKVEEWNKIGKKGILERGTVSVVMTCMDEQSGRTLFDELSKYVQAFFLSTNFGTRQSKGFGSFTATKIILNKNDVSLKSDTELLTKCFKFVYSKKVDQNQCDRIAAIFQRINEDYKILKSGGRTQSKPYVKSKMMLYADVKEHIGWDKKFIKAQINELFSQDPSIQYELKCDPRNKRDSYSERSEYEYFRAMLGLAEQFEFQLQNPPLNDSNNKLIVKVTHPDIKRYQSPILFKVINNDIYFVGNNISSKMLGKTFGLTVTVQQDSRIRDVDIDKLRTPSKFSLVDFIRFAMNDNNLGYITIK